MKIKFRASRRAALLMLITLQVLSGQASAQFFVDAIDWKESEVPPPPSFDVKKLVTFEVPRVSVLMYGVDPETIRISKSDSLVRYVMVISSASGARNVLYEAIRCSTGQFKTYARYSDGKWSAVANSEWRSVFDDLPSKHALWFAKAGACDAAAPQSSVSAMVYKLKNQGNYTSP